MTWTKSSLLNPLISSSTSSSSSSSSSSFHNITTHQEMKRHKVVVRRGESSQSSANSSSFAARTIRYGECQKNHAASVGGYAVDGCREFMPSGEEGSGAAALTCAACGCHRNFHRREVQANEVLNDVSSSNAA